MTATFDSTIAPNTSTMAPPAFDTALYPGTIVSALRSVAALHPDAPALVDPEGTLTYRELWSTVNALAANLRRFGIARGDRVGVAAERTRHSLLSMLALARAGAAYVPLDGTQPATRLQRMIAGSGVRTVVGRSAALTAVPQGLPVEFVHIDLALRSAAAADTAMPDPKDPVYVIHTSGSTGDPKGVLVPHRALHTAAQSLIGLCGIGPGDRVLSFASLSWDTSGEEIYSAFLSGATLVIDPAANSGSIPAFLGALRRNRITVVDLPTAFWNELVAFLDEDGASDDVAAELGDVRLVIIGGEEVRAPQVRAWAKRIPDRIRLLNTYGQTETVLVTHAAELSGGIGRDLCPDDRVPIGTPLGHVQQLLVPRSGADGAAELLVGGPTLSLGYIGKPEETAARFRPGPDGTGLYYHTGDLVAERPDGQLDFVGRCDRQIKIRGLRVEPEEVERVLHAHPDLQAAAVAPSTEPSGAMVLTACIVPLDPHRASAPSAEQVRAWLAERLPDYLVPKHIRAVDRLPLLPNGKVNLKMIAQNTSAPAATATIEEIAAELAELCSAVLGSPCSATDDFFDAGGDSLLATRLISKVYRRFNAELTYVDVFDHRTPAELAVLISGRL
ncbi:non-ribosomal peptide synthetase [Kitasatospora sp. LaBMicrA B282]|uniref:non-ribosomal peptide synthetase n=1 Tax=Kitasatospora sp. LaBMicrA B282 TaxID=3420949 RepID=UPI003D0D4331